MSVPPTFVEVAVLSEDGRHEQLATLHHWEKRDDGWWGHCKVFQDQGGQVWETLPAARLIELVYCPWNPISREAFHRCEGRDLMKPEDQVWA